MLHADLKDTPGTSDLLKVICLRPVGAGSIDLRKEMFVYRLNSTVDMYFI